MTDDNQQPCSAAAFAAFRQNAPNCVSRQCWTHVDHASSAAGHPLAVKLSFVDHTLETMVTDFRRLWIERLEDWRPRFKTLNPNLEGDLSEDVEDWIRQVVCGRRGTTTPGDSDEPGGLTLHFAATFLRLPFRWHFRGRIASHERFYDEVTSPFMLYANEMNRREQQLVDIIRQKDREIEDYRFSGVEVSKKELKTAKFVYQEWSDETMCSQDAINLVLLNLNKETLPLLDDAKKKHVIQELLVMRVFARSIPAAGLADTSTTVIPVSEGQPIASSTTNTDAPVEKSAEKRRTPDSDGESPENTSGKLKRKKKKPLRL